MNYYHGSSESNLKVLEPRESTHGKFLYATPIKALAIHFCKRCGDDLTYELDQYTDENSWDLIELIPGTFDKMYDTSSSIYTVPSDSFKDLKSGFPEVVTSESVEVLEEEYIPNLFEALKELENKGIIHIYRYPNKPAGYDKQDNFLLDKWRFYRDVLHKDISRYEFDRLLLMHPSLLEDINKSLKEFGHDYTYKVEDIPKLFDLRINRQLHDLSHEQYIDEIYNIVITTYKELEPIMTEKYNKYLSDKENTIAKSR